MAVDAALLGHDSRLVIAGSSKPKCRHFLQIMTIRHDPSMANHKRHNQAHQTICEHRCLMSASSVEGKDFAIWNTFG